MAGTTSGGSTSWPAAVAGSAASGMFSGFMQLMQRKTDKQNQIRQNQMNKEMAELEFQIRPMPVFGTPTL